MTNSQRTREVLPFWQRLVASLAMAVVIGSFSLWFSFRYSSKPGGDFNWALHMALQLLHGGNPYNLKTGWDEVSYPLPAALIAIPFSFFGAKVGAALFLGISGGLLAFGVVRYEFTRLWIFASYPFFSAVVCCQWSPIAAATAFIPWIPIAIAKPQVAIPVALTFRRKPAFWVNAGVLLLTLILRPDWPRLWLSQIHGFQGFVPILFWPGPILVIALFWWRERDVQLLLSMALMPQHWFYDAFVLWLIPKSRTEIVFTVITSWTAFVWWYTQPVVRFHDVWLWDVVANYLPMLFVIGFRNLRIKSALGGEDDANSRGARDRDDE